ncbi:MAG: hypothetical protein NC411_06930 [Bacteroides sp.]|nr:hypothetical protein [Bacteroides sp.]
MNENQIFSLNRMKFLLKRDLLENWRMLLLGLGALVGILILIALMTVSFQGDSIKRHVVNGESLEWVINYELGWMTAAFYVIGTFIASLAFKSMATPPGALSQLILPASQFEKFIYRWLAVVPGFFILYFLCAVFADWVMVVYVEAHYGVAMTTIDWSEVLFHPERAGFFMGMTSMVLSIYFVVQSFYFLGALVWSRLSFIKTFVCLSVIWGLYLWFGEWLYGVLRDPEFYYGEPKLIGDQDNALPLGVVVSIVVSLVNYLLAFMRFREAEVIKRW